MLPPQDGALEALGRYCPRLVSLNVALAGSVTDAGMLAISRGCTALQALNVAGAKEASRIPGLEGIHASIDPPSTEILRWLAPGRALGISSPRLLRLIVLLPCAARVRRSRSEGSVVWLRDAGASTP